MNRKMKIYIIGSFAFAKKMVKVKKELDRMGHNAFVPIDTDKIVDGSHSVDDFEANSEHVIKNDIISVCFRDVENCDAVLVLNYKKNGIEGYLGAHTLMELAIAYYLKKKIYIMNNLPRPEDQRWAAEVRTMLPVLIKGDLQRIKK